MFRLVAATLVAFIWKRQLYRVRLFSLVDDWVCLDHKAGECLFRHDNDWIGSHFSCLHWLVEVHVHKVFASLIGSFENFWLKSAFCDLVVCTPKTLMSHWKRRSAFIGKLRASAGASCWQADWILFRSHSLCSWRNRDAIKVRLIANNTLVKHQRRRWRKGLLESNCLIRWHITSSILGMPACTKANADLADLAVDAVSGQHFGLVDQEDRIVINVDFSLRQCFDQALRHTCFALAFCPQYFIGLLGSITLLGALWPWSFIYSLRSINLDLLICMIAINSVIIFLVSSNILDWDFRHFELLTANLDLNYLRGAPCLIFLGLHTQRNTPSYSWAF